MKNYDSWMKGFMEGWKNRDVEAVMATIAGNCAYYETVFDEPCPDIDAIRGLWKVVPENQKDIEYSYEILAENEEYGIFHFQLARTVLPEGNRVEMDGIFQISVDEAGRCIYFRQWRSVREIR
ncbi:MAG TPA: nuclear transport factor 2 family protein [Candidatus Fimivivens sp.]|nr:nuclear transport factor 2 family protein [Candidatus Fimivivens sp.]